MELDPWAQNPISELVAIPQMTAEEPLDEWNKHRREFRCHLCSYSTKSNGNIESHYLATHDISRDQAVVGIVKVDQRSEDVVKSVGNVVQGENNSFAELNRSLAAITDVKMAGGSEGPSAAPGNGNGLIQIVPESILLKEEAAGEDEGSHYRRNWTCCVPGCKPSKDHRYTFPKDDKKSGLWLSACKMERQHSPKDPRICSKHFESDAFIEGTSKLKKDAIPTLNLPGGDAVKNRADEILKAVAGLERTGHPKREPLPDKPTALTTWSPLSATNPLTKCEAVLEDEFEQKPSSGDALGEGMDLDMVVEEEMDIKGEESHLDEEGFDTKEEPDMDGEYDDFGPHDDFEGGLAEDIDLEEDLWQPKAKIQSKNSIRSLMRCARGADKKDDKDAKIRMLEEANTMLRKKVHNLQMKTLKMQKAKKEKKTPKENTVKVWVREYITKHRSATWANFIMESNTKGKDISKGRVTREFTDEEMLKAIGLRRISKKAYNYLRDNGLCPLPGMTTLRSYAQRHPECDIPTVGEYVRPTESKKKVYKGKADDVTSGSDVNPCGRCGKNLAKKAQLHQHLAEVHGDERARKMQCKVCDKWLSNDTIMVGHQNMHMGIKPVKCTFCDRSYQNVGNMKTHCKEAHAEEWKAERGKRISQGRAASKPCQKCGMQFPLLHDLNQHLAEIHEDPEARELQCQTCEKWLSSKLKLKNHMRIHTGERPFQCNFCPMSFLSEGTMYGHQKERHPEDWETNKEQIKARNNEERKRKMRESYRDGKRKKRTSTLIYGNGNGEAPILDEETGMVNEDLFQCDFCDKAFITKTYLLAHQKEVHEQELKDKQWKQRTACKASDNPCTQCGKNFPLKSVLNEHLAEVHDDSAAMKLQCNMCRKWLGSKLLLDNHIRTHTGEKPFKCDFCPKTFTSNKAMGFHRKQMHHEEWEANKEQIMARKQALANAKRYKATKKDDCGKDNGEVTILDEETGMIFN